MPIEKRQSSPSVPFIGLARAIVRARELYDRVGRVPLFLSEAANIWGLAPKTGSAFRTIAALRGYGLIEKDDSADRIHISDLAAVIFESQEAEALQRAFAAAGLNPEIIADYAAKWVRAGRQMRSASPTCRRGTDLPRGQPKASYRYLMKPCGSLAVVRPGFLPPFRRACDRCHRSRRGSGSAILCKHPPIRLIEWRRLGAGSCGLPMANATSTWRKVSPDTPRRRSRGSRRRPARLSPSRQTSHQRLITRQGHTAKRATGYLSRASSFPRHSAAPRLSSMPRGANGFRSSMPQISGMGSLSLAWRGEPPPVCAILVWSSSGAAAGRAGFVSVKSAGA